MRTNLLGWLGATALTIALVLPAAPAAAVTDSDRMAVYKEFRSQFDARQYAAAKPLAAWPDGKDTLLL